MKKVFLSFLMCLSFLAFSQSKNSTKNKIDQKLVGTWKGSETDQQVQGMTKYWVLTRFADGTFSMMYVTSRDCEINSQVETGQWWVEKGEYHELHFVSGNTDVYTYSFPTKNTVKYKVVDSAYVGDTYEFTDTKVNENGQ
ncbi:hypothetical protein Q73A0000_10755 [Kaistella flava (ex Peng et al. 2021)]|uniref:Lipocalin-like domain-containing protein n=1 Tax=Kaistella flava (ex Peng et al. 2021) TaxID=2038776 RepID=A0A7M2Y982_9FLAO|nr:hypothetical protein [Kaistella flava (ex Peng et al. 2021)]QOW10817.1 hypothetical protein Q73A0000_10755 [Kaistella flava (ex Peng et al. 2021)]